MNLTRLRDWWRGYTDADVKALRERVGEAHPGEVIALTRAEIAAFGDLCIRHIGVRDGGIDLVAEHPMVFLMADSLAKFIGDYNYVEMRMTHRKTGENYVMHCQKQSGETPWQQKDRAEKERDAAMKDAERYRALRWASIFHLDADDIGPAAEKVDAATDATVMKYRELAHR